MIQMMTPEQLMQAMAELTKQREQTVPVRVSTAMQFVAYLRSSACKHIDHEAEFPGLTTVCKSTAERDAYNSALGLIKNYFNNEMYPDPSRVTVDEPPRGDDAAGGSTPAKLPPSPPVPTGDNMIPLIFNGQPSHAAKPVEKAGVSL